MSQPKRTVRGIAPETAKVQDVWLEPPTTQTVPPHIPSISQSEHTKVCIHHLIILGCIAWLYTYACGAAGNSNAEA